VSGVRSHRASTGDESTRRPSGRSHTPRELATRMHGCRRSDNLSLQLEAVLVSRAIRHVQHRKKKNCITVPCTVVNSKCFYYACRNSPKYGYIFFYAFRGKPKCHLNAQPRSISFFFFDINADQTGHNSTYSAISNITVCIMPRAKQKANYKLETLIQVVNLLLAFGHYYLFSFFSVKEKLRLELKSWLKPATKNK
jgi:hypothetical protein